MHRMHGLLTVCTLAAYSRQQGLQIVSIALLACCRIALFRLLLQRSLGGLSKASFEPLLEFAMLHSCQHGGAFRPGNTPARD